jgi:tRNA G10  N-methylase Trm11
MKPDHREQYLYLVSRPPGEGGLAELELAALAGVEASGSAFGLGGRADIERSAYTEACFEVLARGRTLEEICQEIEGLPAQGFRIRVKKHPRRLDLDSRQATIALANALEGSPNLSDPQTQFLLAASPEGLCFGRLLQRSDRSWQMRAKKPWLYSGSLSPRMARAMVNLGARPGERLLDPCCGSGTILLEAASMGIKAAGCDLSPLWPPRAAENAAHFGLQVRTWQQDAREVSGDYDVIVTNLPYGQNLPSEPQVRKEILAHLTTIAPKLVLVVADDASEMLAKAGWRLLRQAAGQRGSLTRCFYVCERA